MRRKFVEFSIISDLLKDLEPLDCIIMVSMFASSTEDHIFETRLKYIQQKKKQKKKQTTEKTIYITEHHQANSA